MDHQPSPPFYAYPPYPAREQPLFPQFQYAPNASPFVYAGFMRRLIASWIDSFILAIPLMILFIVLMARRGIGASPNPTAAFITNAVTYLSVISYHVFFTARGGSPGYRAMGMQVTAANGGTPGLRRAVYRQVFFIGIAALWLLYSAMAWINPEVSEPSVVIGIGVAVWGLTAALGIGYNIGCLMVIWDQHKQALHDRVAGTYVIHNRQ